MVEEKRNRSLARFRSKRLQILSSVGLLFGLFVAPSAFAAFDMRPAQKTLAHNQKMIAEIRDNATDQNDIARQCVQQKLDAHVRLNESLKDVAKDRSKEEILPGVVLQSLGKSNVLVSAARRCFSLDDSGELGRFAFVELISRPPEVESCLAYGGSVLSCISDTSGIRD